MAGGPSASVDPAFADQWARIRQAADIQFTPLDPPERTPPPEWSQRFLAWLSDILQPVIGALGRAAQAIGVSGQVLTGILVVTCALVALLLVWRTSRALRLRSRRASDAAVTPLQPASPAFPASLASAERLAGEGRFDEAVHLLLQRSVDQLAASAPQLFGPSVTAREIAALPDLPREVRAAFSILAERVERSLFALRPLNASDWQAARSAYAALAGPPR